MDFIEMVIVHPERITIDESQRIRADWRLGVNDGNKSQRWYLISNWNNILNKRTHRVI